MTSLIKAKNINFNRNNHQILKDICLDVSANDFVTIVGPNGAGKSMLLKCLIGFEKIDSGKIIKKKNLNIGYVPQNLEVNQTMPIKVKTFLKLGKKIDDIFLKKIAKETKIIEILDQQLYHLSNGQMQRVLLANALLNNPQILILDEPAQNLDIKGQLAFYQLLEEIYKNRQIAILMVSHDLHLVMSSSKKVICLFHHICCQGEPKVVTKDPEFISLFGDDMAKMMSVYNHSHNHIHECKEDNAS